MPPRSVAQRFADHLNSLLNRTVTDARLTVLGGQTHPARFTLACLRGTTPVSFAMHGSALRMLIVQTLQVEAEHCETLTCQYRLASSNEKQSWLLRWEYFRRRPTPSYPYPLAHVHVNAAFALDAGLKELPKLHLSTRRVPLELVLWHVISEWDVQLEEFERQRRAT